MRKVNAISVIVESPVRATERSGVEVHEVLAFAVLYLAVVQNSSMWNSERRARKNGN